MDFKKSIYLTTPIYYPNDNLHIGHTYTNIATDTIARYYKANKYDVFFTTGSDEHGLKIEQVAKLKNINPQEHVDQMVNNAKILWKDLNIDYDFYARTTNKQHEKIVQKVWKKLEENGDIYLGSYEGWYCISDETYLTSKEVVDGVCQICGKKAELVNEESYFFKMTKYNDWIKKYYEENQNFIQPKRIQNELLKNFIEPGLKDLSISRTSFSWGVPVPGNEKHVMYVWIDALFNYLTSLNYLEENDMTSKYWDNNAIHIVGKEITRFHGIYWPIFLHALGVNLPKNIFAHGWLLMGNEKISKSKGNVIRPHAIIDKYGSDALRYFLIREIPFGSDGKFTPSSFINRYNSDLVNDFSNLVHRTTSMIGKYLSGTVNTNIEYKNEYSQQIVENMLTLKQTINSNIENFELSQMLENIWSFISSVNKYIDLTQPWKIAKEEDKTNINEILAVLLESITNIGILIHPIMPQTAQNLYKQLNIETNFDFENLNYQVKKFNKIESTTAIFSRLNVEEELEYFEFELKKKILN